uniref:Uncharacterized protein n=1 Tax=Steinernema glaseri TaxID=37863 RepID=A0A1I7Y9U0_9BILA
MPSNSKDRASISSEVPWARSRSVEKQYGKGTNRRITVEGVTSVALTEDEDLLLSSLLKTSTTKSCVRVCSFVGLSNLERRIERFDGFDSTTLFVRFVSSLLSDSLPLGERLEGCAPS